MNKVRKLNLFRIMMTTHNYDINTASRVIGVSRDYLSGILNDKFKLNEETIRKYANALGFTYNDYLLLDELKNNLDMRNDLNFCDKHQRLLLCAVGLFLTNYVPPNETTSTDNKQNILKKPVK